MGRSRDRMGVGHSSFSGPRPQGQSPPWRLVGLRGTVPAPRRDRRGFSRSHRMGAFMCWSVGLFPWRVETVKCSHHRPANTAHAGLESELVTLSNGFENKVVRKVL